MLGRDRAGLLGARLERRLERGLVAAKLGVALAHRRQVLDDRLGDRLLEVAVAGVRELGLDLLGPDPADDREDLDQVRDPGLVVAATDVGAGVGDRAHHLLATTSGSSRTSTVPCSVPPVVAIFATGF